MASWRWSIASESAVGGPVLAGPREERGRRCVGVGIPEGVGGVPRRPGVDSVGRRDMISLEISRV